MLVLEMNKKLNRTRFVQQGFSLIEMAIVTVIVGTLLGGLLLSVAALRENNMRNEAELKIEEIIEALYGFAQTNGRLPCPATFNSDGAESPAGGGNCTQDDSFVPAATLGLSGAVNGDGLLVDPWQNPYRYSVSDVTTNAFTSVPIVAPPQGIRGFWPALVADLRVCGEAACTNIVANQIPAVVLSQGTDWAEFTGADADATENAEATRNGYRHNNDLNFVSTNYIEDVYDDIISWVSPNLLYSRMISAGQLP